jgi:type I restriction enzyme S subunit
MMSDVLVDVNISTWTMSSIGSIATLENGDRGKNYPNKSTLVDVGVPFINAGHLEQGRIDVENMSHITPEHFEILRAGKFRKGDILFCLRGSLGKCAIIREELEGAIASSLVIIRSSQNINKDFLFYFLNSPLAFAEMKLYDNGTAQPNLASKDLARFRIALPPMEEQIKIVEILEEQFSRLDAALASVHAVREKAARFRRSLLHAAFTGALTGHGTSSGALPEGWEKVDLESLLSVSIGGIWGEEDGLSEVDVDVVRVTELKAHGVIEPSTAAKRSITRKQFQSRALQFGDLLLEKSGGGPNSPVGRVGYVLSIDKPTVCSNFMQLMRPDVEQIMSLYLHLFLTFIHSNGETIPLQTSTTNIRNIKTTEYMALKVPVPLPSEQEKIVGILDEQLSRLDAALAVADVIEKKASAMRRSLLHAAFTGDLTREWREGAHV